MEPLWSPGVATGGNQRQIGWLSEPQNKRIPLPPAATGCVGKYMVRRGSTVRVRQRALLRPRKTRSFVFGPTCTSRARSGVESVLEKRVLRPIPSRLLMERALEGRAMFDAHSEMGQRRWNALARAPERSSDARKAYAGNPPYDFTSRYFAQAFPRTR
jgi:hypothetical protein